MHFRRLDRRARLTAICLGLSIGMSGYAVYRAMPAGVAPPAQEVGVEQELVARIDLPAQTLLTPANVEARRVNAARDAVLHDLTLSDHIVLEMPIRAGQPITGFRRD